MLLVIEVIASFVDLLRELGGEALIALVQLVVLALTTKIN